MCDLDLESCSVFDETVIKAARKDHTCDCCGGSIKKGESYLKHFSVFDGSVTWEKQCNACTAMVSEFTKAHKQHSNPSYMPQLLRDCIELERGEDDAVAEKWKSELRAMAARRGQSNDEDKDNEDDGKEDGREEAGKEVQAGDDQDRETGRN